MAKNKENNETDIYVMADEPIAIPVSSPPFSWWIVLLVLFLVITGAIATYFFVKPDDEIVIEPEPTPTKTPEPTPTAETPTVSPTTTPVPTRKETSQPKINGGTQKQPGPDDPVNVKSSQNFDQVVTRPSPAA